MGKGYLYPIVIILLLIHKITWGVPNPPSDTWVNLSPANHILVSTQSSISYDPENDAIYMWGGHPPGGTFPQVPEFWKYDIVTNTWSVIRPDTDQPQAQ